MARIIEKINGERRIIKMSADDIISVVQDYQRIVPRFSDRETARSYLEDVVVYIPED
ncbi:hypothetical protein IJ750_05555 [bacterium]|nr:hypothetical protein [bacterium]